jgi:hypothetical protein
MQHSAFVNPPQGDLFLILWVDIIESGIILPYKLIIVSSYGAPFALRQQIKEAHFSLLSESLAV